MKHYSLFYLIGRAFKGFWRNRVMSFTSVLILTASLVISGSFYCLLGNIDHNLSGIGNINEIVVYINEDYNFAQVSTIGVTIRELDGVEGVSLVTKEQALEEEKEKYAEDYPNLFDALGDENPYRDSYVITYSDDADVEKLDGELRAITGIEKVSSHTDVAKTVSSAKTAVTVIFIVFFIALFVVSLIIIITSVRISIFSRREEISIMRYIGAGKLFIVAPFVFEQIIVSTIAVAASYGIQNLVYNWIGRAITDNYPIINIMPFDMLSHALGGAFIIIGFATGIIGSIVSAAKYLRK